MKIAGIYILAFISAFNIEVSAASTQYVANASTLFEQLQSRETTDSAKEALLKMAQANTETRAYLCANLPAMIQKGWKGAGQQWMNAVRLAGELKIVETAPALAAWISFDSVGSETSAGQFQRLETNPAGKALAQIGDPAIPTLMNVLEHGTVHERRNAYLVLNLINSPRAKATIHARLDHEDDPHLREFIQKTPD